MSRRSTQWLATAAALSCALVVLAAGTAEPSKPVPPDRGMPSQIKDAPLAEVPSQQGRLQRPALSLSDRDPFGAAGPARPPKPAAPALPARVLADERNVPVSAPALPFTFLGRVDLEQVESVFIADGNSMFSVSSGDLLDNRYLVERITETEIVFTHLPTQQRQSLAIW